MSRSNRQNTTTSSTSNPTHTTTIPRQNEYFVPRDGIDREVITADICRYLGNDALVRPGHYEKDGRSTPGYFITAYRNLTSAMIEDLKADSARWERERRAAQNHGSGSGRYNNSQTHRDRQYAGPSSYDDDPYGSSSTPRYPGTGNAGYNGAAGPSYVSQSYSQTPYQSSSGYSQYPPHTADRSTYNLASTGTSGYASQQVPEPTPFYTGSNYSNQRDLVGGSSRTPAAAGYYSGPSGYPVPDGDYGVAGSSSTYGQQPVDYSYGRGVPPAAYGSTRELHHSTPPPNTRESLAPSGAQIQSSSTATSSSSHARERRSDRDQRDREDRHSHRHRTR